MITGIAPDSAAGQVVCAEAHKLDCPVVFCSPPNQAKRSQKSTLGWPKMSWMRSGEGASQLRIRNFPSDRSAAGFSMKQRN